MNLHSLAAYRDNFREYFSRADFFIRQGDSARNPEWVRSISIVSAFYALQAAFEVACTAVSSSPDAEKTRRSRKEFVEFASGRVRYLYLLDALKNHDFHRHAIVFQEGRGRTYGPLVMGVRVAGEIVSAFPDETGRLTIHRAKDGKEIAQPHHRKNALQTKGFHVLEPETGQWIHILQILTDHRNDLAALLAGEGANASSSSGAAETLATASGADELGGD
jgi:hypothetical protein